LDRVIQAVASLGIACNHFVDCTLELVEPIKQFKVTAASLATLLAEFLATLLATFLVTLLVALLATLLAASLLALFSFRITSRPFFVSNMSFQYFYLNRIIESIKFKILG